MLHPLPFYVLGVLMISLGFRQFLVFRLPVSAEMSAQVLALLPLQSRCCCSSPAALRCRYIVARLSRYWESDAGG